MVALLWQKSDLAQKIKIFCAGKAQPRYFFPMLRAVFNTGSAICFAITPSNNAC
jgi:hypothetical protein